jgi:predicted nucleic acid-binding protein
MELYVIDTNSIISHFNSVFKRPSCISKRAHNIISRAFDNYSNDTKLSIPSVVFIEIYEKWFSSDEFAEMFHYEVIARITDSPNIEIKPIEREVLENVLLIGGSLSSHEIHDKLILASAMMLDCPLITSDNAIIDYVEQTRVIPYVVY